MKKNRLLAIAASLAGLFAAPAYPQAFPAQGDDSTGSFGSFQILVEPKFASLFNGCPGYNSTTRVFTSPTLYDPNTRIGRSSILTEDHRGNSPDRRGVPVGHDATTIGDSTPPSSFSDLPDGASEIHTEVRALKMRTFPFLPAEQSAQEVRVRAGTWYNFADHESPPAAGNISPGEVQSLHGTGSSPGTFFHARSYFDVKVRIDLPKCGTMPSAATLYNDKPLIVKADDLDALPPHVVYIHDISSLVPVKFLAGSGGSPPAWTPNATLGCLILAGHGVNYTEAQQKEFEGQMATQHGANACPAVPTGPSGVSIAVLGGSVTAWAVIVVVLRRRRREATYTA